MVDPRRAWLDLQRDLGGDEVIFDVPFVPSFSDAADSLQRPASPRTVPVTRRAVPLDPAPDPVSVVREWHVKEYPQGEAPTWAVDAPTIPGPGIDVVLPVRTAAAASWATLDDVAKSIASCTACPLCEGRTHTVPGEGNPHADLMVVGEGPGEQEDLSGRPFVGRAGSLLDKMLDSIEIPRAQVFIANVVKCRPPRNRAPLPDERQACLPYLQRQIALVQPRVILALGGTAAEALLGVKQTLGSLRLKVHTLDSTPLVVTYHPAALLRNPNWKRPAWDDLRIARQLVDARR
ncbi:MAG: uracil-DNA glycosylase [Gemmatimonadota bacterium]